MGTEAPNRIQLRNGETKPGATDLLSNELGYDRKAGILYVGRDITEDPLPVLVFSDKNNDGHVRLGKPEENS